MVAESKKLRKDCLVDLDKMKIEFNEDLPKHVRTPSIAEKDVLKEISKYLKKTEEFDYAHYDKRDNEQVALDDKIRNKFHRHFYQLLELISLAKISILKTKEESKLMLTTVDHNDSSEEEEKEKKQENSAKKLIKRLLWNYKLKFISSFMQTAAFQKWNIKHYQRLGLTSVVVESTEVIKKVYENGDVYYGTMKNGVPNGKGEIIDASGYIYNGDFIDGRKQGHGNLSSADGEFLYEGSWQDNKKWGEGQLVTRSFNYSGYFEKYITN